MKASKRQLPRPALILIVLGYLLVGGLVAYEFGTSRAGTSAPVAAVDSVSDSQTKRADGPEENKLAPDFSLKDVNGKMYRLSDFRGKVVVLNFWATWCPPCRKEIPDFIELQKTYDAKGLQFIGIALDDEGAAIVKPYLNLSPIPYPILLPDHTIPGKYGEMNVIPTTFLIDRKGVLRTHYVGMRQKKNVEEMLLPLLSER